MSERSLPDASDLIVELEADFETAPPLDDFGPITDVHRKL